MKKDDFFTYNFEIHVKTLEDGCVRDAGGNWGRVNPYHHQTMIKIYSMSELILFLKFVIGLPKFQYFEIKINNETDHSSVRTRYISDVYGNFPSIDEFIDEIKKLCQQSPKP